MAIVWPGFQMSIEASWVHVFNPGLENVRLEVSELGVMALGEVQERLGDSICRFHYTVLCDPDWNVKEISVDRHTPLTGSVDLISDGLGKWYNGACEEIPALEGCAEVDLSASAFTNTIPIRRLIWRRTRRPTSRWHTWTPIRWR